jgi:hypothetical protein
MVETASSWDRTARAALAGRLRAVRADLSAASRRLADRRALDAVAATEAVLGRLAQLIDEVETAGFDYGAWVAKALPVLATPVALASLDHALGATIDELAATVRAVDGSDAVLMGRVAMVRDLVEEVRSRFQARLAALAAATPPAPVDGSVADVPLGDRVEVEGRAYQVAGRTRWARGDCSLNLGDATHAVMLWQDVGGALAVLDGQALAISTPGAPTMTVEGAEFRLRWRDGAGGVASGSAGRIARSAERWLYASTEGVLLWMEREDGAEATYRGTGLAPADFRRL